MPTYLSPDAKNLITTGLVLAECVILYKNALESDYMHDAYSETARK